MSKYYKILKDNLMHHKYTFHEGLNIDPNPWNSGKCKPGGFYYSDANNILTFCDYGNLICDIEIPDDAQTEHYDENNKSNKIIVSNIRPLWTAETIKDLVNNNVNIHADNDFALRYVSTKGYTDTVKLLLDLGADIHAEEDFAIRLASTHGHTDTVKLLIDYGANIHAYDNVALRHASENGHTDIVKLLEGIEKFSRIV